MSLSEATIKSLKQIIREDYGRDISFEEAEEIANDLTQYYDTLAKIWHEIETETKEQII